MTTQPSRESEKSDIKYLKNSDDPRRIIEYYVELQKEQDRLRHQSGQAEEEDRRLEPVEA
jgi:hypothetical protein